MSVTSSHEQRFLELDGLRGIAILLVIVGHVQMFDFHVDGRLAGFGVMVFFVLSGFLITRLLDREVLKTGTVSLSSFYLRRALRLFPALFCFIAVLCVLIQFGVIKDTPWYTVAACLLYVRNIWGRGSSSGHLWSLSIEEQFYMFWPWIMRACKRTTARRIAAGLVIGISAFRMVAIYLKWFDYQSAIFYERSWFRFDSILVGCVVALWLDSATRPSRTLSYLSSGVLTALLWPTALAWCWWGEAISPVWYITLQMIFATLILVNLLLSGKTVYRTVLSNSTSAWIGRMSYSWYLWHPFFMVPNGLSRLGIQTFPINVIASLALAIISYKFIEQPFLRLKDRLSLVPRRVKHAEPEIALSGVR